MPFFIVRPLNFCMSVSFHRARRLRRKHYSFFAKPSCARIFAVARYEPYGPLCTDVLIVVAKCHGNRNDLCGLAFQMDRNRSVSLGSMMATNQ